MTEDEKKQELQEYTNLCAKLGDLLITKQIIEFDIETVKEKAKEKLKELKRDQTT